MTSRAGFVLLYSLLVVLMGAAITAGMLALAGREALIARRYVEIARARGTAEGDARNLFQSWSTRAYADLAPGEQRVAPTVDSLTAAAVTRLDTSLFLISVVGIIPAGAGPPVVARAGLLVRTLPPLPPEQLSSAVSAAESVLVRGGRISARDLCRADGGGIGPGIRAPAVDLEGAEVHGDPPVARQAPEPVRPGTPLHVPTAASLAGLRVEAPELTPRPRSAGGVCEIHPANWGAVSALHPCSGLQQIIYSPGDLTVRGGEGRGVLVVDGDLVLEGGFQFHGLVVVRGTLTLSPGTRIRGTVSGVRVVAVDSEIVRDDCAIDQALGNRALDRAYRPGARWWIPVF